MTGWILLHRKLKEWEWFTDVNTCHLFITLLLEANHTTTKWRGVDLKKGQLLTGRKTLAAKSGLSEQQIRTCLKHLQSTSEITITTHNKYSIITITNWNDYQAKTNISTSNPTNNQPAINQQSTTSNNINNLNNVNKEEDFDFLKYKNIRFLIDKTSLYVSPGDRKFVKEYEQQKKETRNKFLTN